VPDVKKIVFTFITVILVPLLFFVLVEVSLKIFDVGTSFNYFHKIDIKDQPHFQDNPDFANQFYPSSLGIGPLENTFPEERSPELIRVYVLGGSAAMGFPHKNHGLDRLLATQLRAAFPSRKIEVINTAMTSVNSHVVYEVARSIPEDSADFAVILMGNNEVVGPYGPGTFNQNFLGNISLIRGVQALKRTRIWQALDGLILQVKPTDAKQDLEWKGMQMFTNNGVSHDDPRMQSVLRASMYYCPQCPLTSDTPRPSFPFTARNYQRNSSINGVNSIVARLRALITRTGLKLPQVIKQH
jgi:hypothetical protein